MKNPYLIVVDEKFPRQEFLAALSRDLRFGAWFYSMANSFFIYSSVNASCINELIKSKYGDKYRFFITELDDKNRQGWMPVSHWNIIYTRGAEKVFTFNFSGYYLDASDVPTGPGLFNVYRCIHCEEKKTVKITELLLVGGAQDVRVHLSNQINVSECQGCCDGGECLCYGFSPVELTDLQWGIDSHIHQNKARCNHESIDDFAHGDTLVITTGDNNGLKSGEMIERTVA